MSNPFFAEFFGTGNLAKVQKFTRGEQTPYDDRMPETDHFENHPVGIRMFDATARPVGRPRGRGGVHRVPLTELEQSIWDQVQEGVAPRFIAENHGLTWSQGQKEIVRIKSKMLMRERRARK